MARVINLENALDRLTLRVQHLEDAVFEDRDNDTDDATVVDADLEEEDAKDEDEVAKE